MKLLEVPDTLIIDFHAHPMTRSVHGMVWDEKTALNIMDQIKIQKMCLFNVNWGDVRYGNDQTATIVERHPDRFVGFTYVNPLYVEEVVPELTRTVEEFNFRGIKIYPPDCELPINHPSWEPVFKFACKRKLPVISHTEGDHPYCSPALFGEVAEKFSDLPIVLGHSGNWRKGREEAISIAQKHPNIYLEISTSWRNPGSIEELVKGVGADRVLFGSDFPLMDPRIHLARVIMADISEMEKEKILGENAINLLGLSR